MKQADLEIDLLRTFVTVAETGNFTTAGDVLGRTQSAISQQIRRLEDIAGRQLLSRSKRAVALTPDGELLLDHAYSILNLNDEAMRRMKQPPLEGRLRLGIAEDFIPHQLPALLARFRRVYPGVRLDLMTGLSTSLVATLGEGRLDLVIAKRDAQPQAGRVIWREPMMWIAAEDAMPDADGTLPLVVLRAPCSYRQVMLDVLKSAQRPWRVSCTAHSILGVQAAVRGGMGFSILGRSFAGWDIAEAQEAQKLPSLPYTEIAVFGEEGARVELADGLVGLLTEALQGATHQAKCCQRRTPARSFLPFAGATRHK